MKKGKEYEVTIHKTEFPGYGVAETDGKKLYIKNSLPGQRIKARVSKKKKGYAEGQVIEILEDVTYKIEPKCPHFDSCGGCTHQSISYEKQLQFKKEQVLELLDNGGIEDYEFLGIVGSPEEFGYRNKMEFTFGDFEKGGELSLGMHVRGRSFGILTTNECHIVDEDYRRILNEVLVYCREKEFSFYRIMSHEGYLRNLVIRKAKSTGQILVNLVTTSQKEHDFSDLVQRILSLKYTGYIKGFLHTINDSLSDVVQADRMEILYGEDFMIEEILGMKFKISPFSFFQTNTKGAEKLYSIVRDFVGEAGSKVVFDLYCGTGTIGQIVAPTAKKVLGIELVEEAVKAANDNAKMNGLSNCEFIAGDIAKVIQTIEEKPDLIILDPPRAGVHPMAMDYVLRFNAPEIVYVSCNPKSLVADLKEIIKHDYKVEKIILMDMFPHTPHIETVVRITKQ